MKRNINLQELSRDHHHGLLLGWKIREGFKKQAPGWQIKNYVEYFFAGALLPHFKEEEELMLSFLKDNNNLKKQTLQEHQQIEHLVKELENPDDLKSTLLEIGRVLENHIRFEERTLFPYLEQHLTEAELEQIGNALNDNHSTFTDTYPYEFWKYDN